MVEKARKLTKVAFIGGGSQNGYLPYVSDRHTCEFFNSYMTDKDLMRKFKLVRTSIADREKIYEDAAKSIELMTEGEKEFARTSSRETAADIMNAIIFNGGFVDVVNMANTGQIENLPRGKPSLKPMGYVDGTGFTPLVTSLLPESVRVLCLPHAETQITTVRAGLSGDLEEALMALVADPVCAHMTASNVKKMGLELLAANREWLPQFKDL